MVFICATAQGTPDLPMDLEHAKHNPDYGWVCKKVMCPSEGGTPAGKPAQEPQQPQTSIDAPMGESQPVAYHDIPVLQLPDLPENVSPSRAHVLGHVMGQMANTPLGAQVAPYLKMAEGLTNSMAYYRDHNRVQQAYQDKIERMQRQLDAHQAASYQGYGYQPAPEHRHAAPQGPVPNLHPSGYPTREGQHVVPPAPMGHQGYVPPQGIPAVQQSSGPKDLMKAGNILKKKALSKKKSNNKKTIALKRALRALFLT